MGVMSVINALFEFSIPTVVSYQDVGDNSKLVDVIASHSTFLQSAATEHRGRPSFLHMPVQRILNSFKR